ncbi:MAG: alpha/beta hydrolase [Desulfobacterales bacterium]
MYYLNYDKPGLDAQYNLRAAVKEYQAYFDEWSLSSQKARSKLPGELDLAYGSGSLETLDIFFTGRPNAPLLVFIHGGYWQGLDKNQFSHIADGFVNNGVATAVVNYSLAPEVSVDEIVRQNRTALAWIWRHADNFGYDPDRIHVCGHSAGGHLAVVLAATDWASFDQALPPDLIKGVCAVSGIFDLEPIRRCYLNDVLGMDAAVSKRNSPLYNLPDNSIPLILAVGELETDEFQRQTQILAECWRSRGFPADVIHMAGFHHFSVVNELVRSKSPLNQAVLRQIKP